jgi:hypothetical protein
MKVYEKYLEATPGYLVFDSGGISLGKMTYPGATKEILIVS